MNWKIILCLLVPLAVLGMPTESIPLEGITVVEHRLMAIFLFAVLSWVLEPIPVFATSVTIIMLELLMLSNKGIKPLMESSGEGFGHVMSYQSIMATFASPIIILFLGGFFLATAATKYRLDTNLARVFLKPFGTSPKMVMLGLMLVTAIFSMFMSNTATTAMMLAVFAPVVKDMKPTDRGRAGLVLAIPFAANVGGIGTPIGTPPNAIAMKYLTGDSAISFGAWMAFAVPYVIVLLLITWVVLLFLFPAATKEVHVSMKGKFLKTGKAYVVYAVFGLTILLWLLGSGVHGMSSHVVALIPVTLFVATKIVTAKDLRGMSWDVLWLVSGGIALGLALEKTGLSERFVSSLPLSTLPPLALIAAATGLALVMANFMSHTATANLLLPIMAALGTSVSSIQEMGGSKLLLVAVTFACSLAMAMPISTPPNALGHATGMISTNDMARSGVIIGFVGILLSFAMLAIMSSLGLW